MDFFTVVFDYEESEVGFYGGERLEITREWYDYLNDMTPEKKKTRQRNYIYIGIGVFVFVVIVLICCIVRREKKVGNRFENQNNEFEYA